jgi:hypothetical protein
MLIYLRLAQALGSSRIRLPRPRVLRQAGPLLTLNAEETGTRSRDRRRSLTLLQLLQQLFRFGSVGKRRARAEQCLEHCLGVGSPAEPVERDR